MYKIWPIFQWVVPKNAMEEQTALCAAHRTLDGTATIDVLICCFCYRALCATVGWYSLLLAGPANKAVSCVIIRHILAPDSSSAPPPRSWVEPTEANGSSSCAGSGGGWISLSLSYWLLRCHIWRSWPRLCFIVLHEMCQLIGCGWKSSSLSQSGYFLCLSQDYVHSVFESHRRVYAHSYSLTGGLLHLSLRDLRRKAKLHTIHSSDPYPTATG